MHPMNMRDRIRERLEALSLTPRAASLKAGLNTHYLQKVLADPDKSITTDNLVKLAETLETSPEWLLSGVESEVQDPDLRKVVSIWPKLLARDKAEFAEWLEFKSRRSSDGADSE